MRTLDNVGLKENDRQAVSEAAAILRSRFPVQRII